MQPAPRSYLTSRWYRPLVAFIGILMILSLACNMPGDVTPTPTNVPGVVPTLAATSAPKPLPTPSQPLPPTLLETSPLPLAEIGSKIAPLFTFNQTMDKPSVESALQSDPPVAGRFEWVDAAAVRFIPDKPLPLDTQITFTFSKTARAANGLTLQQPISTQYRVAGGVSITDRLPTPDDKNVDAASAVVAAFSRPMVPLGADPATLLPAFTLNPPAKGRSEWLNTSTFIFYPEVALKGGTTYRVEVNPTLTSADGATWDAGQPVNWSFRTALAAITAVVPDPKNALPLDAHFRLTFNQPLDAAAMQTQMALFDPGGVRVPSTITAENDAKVFKLQPNALLNRKTVYTLKFSPPLEAVGLPEVSYKFTTVPVMGVASTTPTAGTDLTLYDQRGNVNIRFTAPVAAKQSFKDLVTIEPQVSNLTINATYDGMQIYFSGKFEYRTTYRVRVSANLLDKWDGKIAAPFEFQFKTAAPTAAFNYAIVQPYNGMVFLEADQAKLSANVTNLKTLTLTSASITVNDFLRLTTMTTADRLKSASAFKTTTWTQNLTIPADTSTPISLPILPGATRLEPGIYYYSVTAPELTGKTSAQPPTLMVVASPIHMTLKTTDKEIFVWAVTLADLKPAANAPIVIYQKDGSQLGSGKTDANGLATIALGTRKDRYEALYAVLGKPGQAQFSLGSTGWTSGLNGYEFGLNTYYATETTQTYFYTDRPIYRPGQTIYYRGVLKKNINGRYSSLDQANVTMQLYSDYLPESGDVRLIASQSLPISTYGTINGSFLIPADATPGTFTLRLDGLNTYELPIDVALYRKPEIDLQVSFDRTAMQAGEDLTATIKANYYFGAPAGNMDVTWTLYNQQNYFDLPGGFQTGVEDFNWMMPYWWRMGGFNSLGEFVISQSGKTNADGTLTVKIPAKDLTDKLDGRLLYHLTMEARIEQADEAPLASRGGIDWRPAKFVIGLRPDVWFGQAKKEIGFSVFTADWTKAPSPNHALTAVFQKIEFKENPDWNYASLDPRFEVITKDIGSVDLKTDAQGAARVSFTPPDSGTYRLSVRGEGAASDLVVWVGGEARSAWPNLPNQQLRLVADASSYTAGKTAKILIPNPLQTPAVALVTVERGKVMRSQTITITSDSYELALPLTDADAPNVYVSVTLLGRTGDGKMDFRQGFLQVDVAPAALTLTVELVSDPQVAAPGSEVRFTIRVKDSAGKPVQSEFSVALIDKAILALADRAEPGILKSFYGTQPLGVSTSMGMTVFGQRLEMSAPGRGGGGGGDEAMTVREEYKDTAYWTGAIVTDANGLAEVKVKLPDNLTTWVLDVRGLTKDTRVGEGTLEVVATKELVIRPQTPRFLVAGDRVEFAAVVNNNTKQKLAVEVSLRVTGADLEDSAKTTQTIQLDAGGRQRVTWWGTVQSTAAVELIFSAKSGSLTDSARPESGTLPVLQYASPQTFGTSGVLAEAGERLEVVSLPRSVKAAGGELRLELSPSLAAVILNGLEALDAFPADYTEPIISRLLPNLEVYRAVTELGIDSPDLKNRLIAAINDGLTRINLTQDKTGGWAWTTGYDPDPYLSTYVLYTLNRAVKAGVGVDAKVISNAQNYLLSVLPPADTSSDTFELNRLAFMQFTLQETGSTLNLNPLYELRTRLDPWAKAMLALAYNRQSPTSDKARTLISDLQTSAVRSSTGVNWQSVKEDQGNFATANFNTAIVTLTLARLDPASSLLTDAVLFLAANRRQTGCWSSSYESAWILAALTETLKGTGDLQANFAYSAKINGSPLASGKAAGPTALTPVETRLPIQSLVQNAPNALQLFHEAGAGRLYYRAYLQVYQAVESAPPLNRGISISRAIYNANDDCSKKDCKPITSVKISDRIPLIVRLTITVPKDMYYVVVEDYIPAGAEIVNTRLKTTALGQPEDVGKLDYKPGNPFGDGWNWWIFGSPKIYNDHIRWVGQSLTAGTYELTYRLDALQSGDFHLLPAHAYAYYFPEVEGASAGAVFKIQP